MHSFFSLGSGVASPRRLVTTAAELGYRTVGLTDDASVAGAVELHQHARTTGVKALLGSTVPVRFGDATFPLVLISASRSGYGVLNELLTHLHGEESGSLSLPVLLAHTEDLFCLTGGRAGFPSVLLGQKRTRDTEAHLRALKAGFKDRLFVQLFHDQAPRDRLRVQFLRTLAHDLGVAAVAAPEIRLAEPGDVELLDALICGRLGITVDEPHPLRPRNDANNLLTPERWAQLIPYPDALENAERIAREAAWDLLPDRLTPPAAKLPSGMTPQEHLEQRCYAAMIERVHKGRWRQMEDRLRQELTTVRALGLAEFFLVAAEVTDHCRRHGILAAGRGSAAASVLCYLLGITHVDPVRHGLLWERFLHTGKTSMPDVDIDISSSRRDEVIRWVEERWGSGAEAMVCNRITYRLKSAIQDIGRALGLPEDVRDKLSRHLGRDYGSLRPHRAREAESAFTEVLGDAPVKEVLISLLERIEPKFVRHLAPHSGGVVLSRDALSHYSPQWRSTGGIKTLAFDKDDIEQLGLIKLDLLGLRMLSALEHAREEVMRLTGEWLDFGNLPDEPAVWARIANGDTLGVFQIESPGQVRLSTQLKPRNMRELAHQVALFRPGPIQSSTVGPYVRRARGDEQVPPLPSPLNEILRDTHGVILFQEQILRIAVRVCGMDWVRADRFRKQLSEAEDDEDVTPLRNEFVQGAVITSGWDEGTARWCFELCAVFKGYGFAESHAHAFAAHAYASAWMRHHHPAAFLAGVLTEHPGMWPAHTLALEARRWGVQLAPVCVNRSGVKYRAEDARTVRVPLVSVAGVSEAAAQEVVLERLGRGRFTTVEDFYHRVNLKRDVMETLVKAGAMNELEPVRNRRMAFHRLTVLANASPPGRRALLAPVEDTPELHDLLAAELLRLDHATKGLTESGMHPMDLLRGELRSLGVRALVGVRPGARVRTAGLIVARQRPPTARGFAFYEIEHGSTRAQIIISPDLWEAHRQLLRDASALIVEGAVEGVGRYLSVKAERLAELPVHGRVRGYDFR